MGYGAVKYADLKNSRTTNYKFSFDAMLDLRGNTAVYLLYAHARIAGIVRKSGRDIDALVADGKPVVLEHPKERELALMLAKVSRAGWGVGVGACHHQAVRCRMMKVKALCGYLSQHCLVLQGDVPVACSTVNSVITFTLCS
jgi:hypothetical protein